MTQMGIKWVLPPSLGVGLICAFYCLVAASPHLKRTQECLIPPAYDPGIGGIYFCPPDEGERYLIKHARRGRSEQDLSEDSWVNFRGVFNDQVWVNIGLQEASDASLPAWDALASLVEWMQSIKKGDREALDAFLAPIEMSPTYSQVDLEVRKKLLHELKLTPTLPKDARLRVILYHVHLMPATNLLPRQSLPLNPLLSLPSREDLLQAPLLVQMAPNAESKIAVPAGIWTYRWDKKQAERFVQQFFKGSPDIPFFLKYEQVFMRYAMVEYTKQGLHNPTALTTKRLHAYTQVLRKTGAILEFNFAADWATFQSQGKMD